MTGASWSVVPPPRRGGGLLGTGRIERIRPATRVRPGDVFHCPDNGDIAMILSGTLVVELMMTGGSVLPLMRYGAGDVAPMLDWIATPAFSMGYRAVEATEMSWLPSEQIDDRVREGIARARDALLSAAMRQITSLACLPAADRLYVELLRCAQQAGDGAFALPTHGELSSRVCTTRETISREIAILRREGVLSEGKIARLLAPADLTKRIARALNLDRDADVRESFGMTTADAA